MHDLPTEPKERATDEAREQIAQYLWARYDSMGSCEDGHYTWDEMGDSIRIHYYTDADQILGYLRDGKELEAFSRSLDRVNDDDGWDSDDE